MKFIINWLILKILKHTLKNMTFNVNRKIKNVKKKDYLWLKKKLMIMMHKMTILIKSTLNKKQLKNKMRKMKVMCGWKRKKQVSIWIKWINMINMLKKCSNLKLVLKRSRSLRWHLKIRNVILQDKLLTSQQQECYQMLKGNQYLQALIKNNYKKFQKILLHLSRERRS